jgi:hypothetical protein
MGKTVKDLIAETVVEMVKDYQENAPLSVKILAKYIKGEVAEKEGITGQPTMIQAVKSPTLRRWMKIVTMKDREEQDRLAREWLEEILD